MRRIFIALLALSVTACGAGSKDGVPANVKDGVNGQPANSNKPQPTEAVPVSTPPPCDEKFASYEYPATWSNSETEPAAPTSPKVAPCKLYSKDVVVGTGAEVKETDTITVQYAGWNFSDGKMFDASWTRGQPATFPLSGVIRGWTKGIPGMKIGGRRLLVIPWQDAYGAGGRPGIAPYETLVFVVDVVSIGGGAQQ